MMYYSDSVVIAFTERVDDAIARHFRHTIKSIRLISKHGCRQQLNQVTVQDRANIPDKQCYEAIYERESSVSYSRNQSKEYVHQFVHIPHTHSLCDHVGLKTQHSIKQWTMTSRTKRIVDMISTKPSDDECGQSINATQTKTQAVNEITSVAIYMCTLVECYKINETYGKQSHG